MQSTGQFGVVAAAFALVWGATLAIGNAPFPILHDMSEAYVWGREFQLGYNQHPPFWAWICGLWFQMLPRTGSAFAFLGALNAAVGLWGAWALIGDFAGGQKRQAALALLLLTPFYTFGCYKYDANTIFLSLWPWLAHLFVVSLRARGTGASAAFGALAGLCLLSKYYAVVLFAALTLGALQTAWARPWLRSPAPWIAAAVASALFAPHLIWLLTHDAPPLRYFGAVSGRPFGDIAGDAAKTALSSLGSLAVPFALVVGFARGHLRAALGQSARRYREEPDFRLLLTLAFAPLILTLVAGLAARTKLTPEMPIGAFTLAPLAMIEALQPRETLTRTAPRLAVAWLALMLAASPLVALLRIWPKPADIHPHPELAAEATRFWREQTGRPLGFVAGHGDEDAVAFYSADPARAFYNFDYARSLWITLAAVEAEGLTIVCGADDTVCEAQARPFLTPEAKHRRVTLAREFLGLRGKPHDLLITVVPPR